MKLAPAVAVALIICGTATIALPPLSDYLYNRTIARILLEASEPLTVTLHGRMEPAYKYACWLTGVSMIAVGAIASLQSTPTNSPTPLSHARPLP